MSPKTLFLAAAAFAASAAATAPAFAAGDPPTQTRPAPLRASIIFNLIDQNGDGAIDATEAAALQKAIFGALDANKDGKLTPDEFRKVADGFMGPQGPRGPGQFMGRGGPGGRFGMQRPGFFNRGPGDHRQGKLEDQKGPDGQQLGQNDQGQPAEAAPPQPRDFASLDKNGDGVISPDEFATGMPPMPGMPGGPAPQQ